MANAFGMMVPVKSAKAQHSARRRDDGRFKLRYGPYRSPVTRVGRRLFCQRLGTVTVIRFSDGDIPWPIGSAGLRQGHGLVLCGDLVRAIRKEAATAVARAWGVNQTTVSAWRRLLGVERFNAGTHHLFLQYQGKGLTAEATARGRAMQTPDRQAEWGRRRAAEGRTRKRKWTVSEDALLGTMPDLKVARRLGCNAVTVAERRLELGVPMFALTPALAAAHRAAKARLLAVSPEKLRARRLSAGLFQTQVAQRCGWQTCQYQRIESGRQRNATHEVLARIAAALRCRVEDLVEKPTKRGGVH